VTRPSLPVSPLPAAATSEAAALPTATTAIPFDESRTAEPFVPPPPLQVGPAVRIEEVIGTTPGAAGVMLAPAMEPLKACESPTKGKLVIRVIAEKERAHLRVTDSGDLQAETHHCVLEALSTIDLDRAFQQSASPSDKPAHIETQLVITW
jgi:hypothetical protein